MKVFFVISCTSERRTQFSKPERSYLSLHSRVMMLIFPAILLQFYVYTKTFQDNLLQIKGIFSHSLNSFHIALSHPSGLQFRLPIIAFSTGKARWIAIQFNLAHKDAFTIISSKHDVDIWGSTCKNALLSWVIKCIHILSWMLPFQLTAVKKIKKWKK